MHVEIKFFRHTYAHSHIVLLSIHSTVEGCMNAETFDTNQYMVNFIGG